MNTPFEKLSDKWQAENIGAARFALDLTKGSAWLESDERLADKVHQNWSKNNPWDDLSKIPYAQLSEEEKGKHRQQVLWAKEINKPKGVMLEEERWGSLSNFAAQLLHFKDEMETPVWGEFNGEVIELDGVNLTNVNQIIKRFDDLKQEKRERWAKEEAEKKLE